MLAALRRRHYSTFQAVNRVDGRRKRLSKWVECEIILLNRENSVFQVHVLNWVHPCQAVNNALSLLPSARVTGRLLHNSQCRMGYCFSSTAALPARSRGMQELLSSKWSNKMTSTSSFYCSSSDFSCPLWLGCCTPTPKSSQKSTWPGEVALWLCQSSSLWQNKVLLKQWGWLPSFFWLEIDTLAASACTCQYEQTQQLFFASHMIRVDGINGIKILQWSQCHIQSEENASAVS